jgi:hypothetical protein
MRILCPSLSPPFLPSSTAMVVLRAAAAALTSVFPKSTAERNFSGFSTIFWTRTAPRTPVLTRYSSRKRCSEMKAVSVPEKKAERTRQTTSRTI